MAKSCTLEIFDEVNVKIHDLDTVTRRKLHSDFKYMLPYARHMPAYKLGRWDGTTPFFQMGGRTFLNMLDEILPKLMEYGYEVTSIDDRRKTYGKFTFPQIEATSYSESKWPAGHPSEGQPIILRDYQIEIVNKFLDNPQSIQQIATGAGKTLVTAVLSNQVEPYGKSIVVVPSVSLVKQTCEDYVNMGLDVGVYYGGQKDTHKTHTICTWQSLSNLIKKGGEALAELMDGLIAVIVDEAHGAKATELKSILTQSFAHIPIRWGMTGTIPKEKIDSTCLRVGIGPFTHDVSAKELQDKGVLSHNHIDIIQTLETKEYKEYHDELKFLTTDQERVEWAAGLVDQISNEGNTLVLVGRVETGKRLAELIPGSTFVSGAVKADSRKETYDEVKTEDNMVIIATYGVAAVGINMPRIFNLVLVEPGKSFVRVIQSIGRGIRRAKDKDFVQIWDLCATTKYSKRHLTDRKRYYREAHYPFKVHKVDRQKPLSITELVRSGK